MIDLCKLFGVREGEEFKIEDESFNEFVYRIQDNTLLIKEIEGFSKSTLEVNIAAKTNIIKLPMKIEFTNDELCILRNINKKYKWITRTESNMLYVHINKPIKSYDLSCGYWIDDSAYDSAMIGVYNHLFNCIQWDDEEPVFIDDYVKR